MSEEVAASALALIAEKITPGARVGRTWPLRGGISAHMTGVELVLPEGGTRRVILRQPANWALRDNPRAAAHEYGVLEVVYALGIAAPLPLLLDESGDILPLPYLMLEYIEGHSEHSPVNEQVFVAQMAAQMAQIHRIDGAHSALTALPQRSDWLADVRAERQVEHDEALGPRQIRAILRQAHPLLHPNATVLLHGDLWPGNIVWRDGLLEGVIDWEEAHVGDPLEDLAIARFDVLTMLGRPAMEELTRVYASVQPQVDLTDLPYWDLYAALRPMGDIAEWARGWSDLGRPDITEAVLRAAHQEFVVQAMDRLPR